MPCFNVQFFCLRRSGHKNILFLSEDNFAISHHHSDNKEIRNASVQSFKDLLIFSKSAEKNGLQLSRESERLSKSSKSLEPNSLNRAGD